MDTEIGRTSYSSKHLLTDALWPQKPYTHFTAKD